MGVATTSCARSANSNSWPPSAAVTPTAGASKHSRLERLPIDAMKIDKSFLEDAGAGENGVETAKQWEFLTRAGCDYAPG